jgi:CBS domain-containing protein
MVTVKDILDKKGNEVFSISPDKTVFEALKILADKDIGALLVMQGEQAIGIFSERDYARKLILKGVLSKESKVGDVMSKDLVVVSPETDIFKCMQIMTEKKFRHLPIVDNTKLIGIVSIGDIVNAIIHSQEVVINDLEGYIKGGGYGYSS